MGIKFVWINQSTTDEEGLMFRFNYSRSWTLHSVKELPGGILRINTFARGSFDLPKDSVQTVTTPHLGDTNLQVVDLGDMKRGQQPTKAIIAAGTKSLLPKF